MSRRRYQENYKKTKLVVITGITGKLGQAYIKALVKHKDVKCVGFTRREPEKLLDGVEYRYADLLNKSQVRKVVRSLRLWKFKEVILIHPVGYCQDSVRSLSLTNLIRFNNLFLLNGRSISAISAGVFPCSP